VNLYLAEVQSDSQKIPGISTVGIKSREAFLRSDALNQFIDTLDGIAGTTEIS